MRKWRKRDGFPITNRDMRWIADTVNWDPVAATFLIGTPVGGDFGIEGGGIEFYPSGDDIDYVYGERSGDASVLVFCNERGSLARMDILLWKADLVPVG